jgi:lipopolysaccharide transport system permease protein
VPPAEAEAVTVVEARPGWRLLNLAELWRYRELLVILAWRDVKVRYKQTVLGAAWAVVQPVAMMVVFSLTFGRVAGLYTGGVAYPVFILAGLLPWLFFSSVVASAAQSVVGNQSLVTKVYFPRLLIPLASAGPYVVDLALGSVILAGLMAAYGVAPGGTAVLVPLLLAGLAVAALGAGILLAALTVAYRDFRYVVPFLLQLWMFATPSIYMDAVEVVGPKGAAVMPLNPAYGFIANLRAALLGRPLDGYSVALSAGAAVALAAAGCLYFRRVERGFADII